MKFGSFVALSLLANVVLAGWWAKTNSSHIAGAAAPVAGEDNASPGETSPADKSAAGRAAADRPQGARWRDLESRDLAGMIRRLRNAGCPEETIQDLIVAQVNRDYGRRSLALRDYLNRPYWRTDMPFDANSKERRETMKKMRELQKEKSGRLVELLGVDPDKERRKQDGLPEQNYYSFMAARVEFLPESKREAAANYLEQFEEKMQDFYRESQGLWDSETRAEQQRLETERSQGLSQFLTPDEVREYELRNSQMANQLSYDLRSLSLSREQYEAIFDLRKKYGETLHNYADSVESKTARDQVEQNKKAFNADLAEALGPDFAKEYVRSQDHSYQQLTRLAKRNDLPPDTANTIYDLKETAEQSAKALRDDTTATSEQRKQALEQIRTQTEETIKNALGEAVYQKYVTGPGGWIRNLIYPPPSIR